MELAIDGAIQGVPLSPRVQSIIRHERRADQLDVDADAERWAAAEEIAGELADGKPQRQLAREIGKHHNHVRWMAACHEWILKYPRERPPFNKVYNSREVRQKKEEPEKGIQEQPPKPELGDSDPDPDDVTDSITTSAPPISGASETPEEDFEGATGCPVVSSEQLLKNLEQTLTAYINNISPEDADKYADLLEKKAAQLRRKAKRGR